MSTDAPSKCVICHEAIPSCVDESWLWECRQSQIGPMHHGCAEDLILDDPETYSRIEPEQAEPEHHDDYDHRMSLIETACTKCGQSPARVAFYGGEGCHGFGPDGYPDPSESHDFQPVPIGTHLLREMAS